MRENLPSYYRLDLSEKIAVHIKNGRSLNLIGLPSVGKYVYLQHFVRHRKTLLGESDTTSFKFINTREFRGYDLDDYKGFFARRLGASGMMSFYEHELEEISNEPVYVIIRYINELESDLLLPIMKHLNILRQAPFNFRFIFTTHRPVSEKVKDKILRARLVGTEEYFQPDNQKDFAYKMKEYEKHLRISLNKKEEEDVYDLSDGHGGYIKLVLSYIHECKMKFKENDLHDRIRNNDLPQDFVRRTEELLSKFNDSELEILTALSTDTSESHVIPQLLLDLGIVKEHKGRAELFSEILVSFLHSSHKL